MAGLIRLLIIAALGLVLSGAPVAAQDIRIEPIPPHVQPQWTQMPEVPGVFWASNIPTDVFRHGSTYYFFWEGYLYSGSKPKGPWKSVTKVPDWVGTIPPYYFKTLEKQPGAPPEGLTSAPPAPAPDIRIEPIPPQVKPQWTQVPNVPGVSWAPNISTDVFRHGSTYYFFWEGYLYSGSKPKGPWKSVTKVPDWLSQIDPSHFKTLEKKPGVPPEGLTSATPTPAPKAAPPPQETAPATPAPGKEGAPAAPITSVKPPKVM